jgi:hypothetical protein
MADEQTQADLFALGRADAVDFAQADLHTRRPFACVQRIGGGGTRRNSTLDE